MTSKKNTRRALFMSTLSLILCFAMLMGTTFAWFTDSVTSGTNLIKAGNLDVELYHGKNGPTNKVDDKTKLFTDVNGAEIALWEPGVVAYTNMKVVNAGTLALKYDLFINATNENATSVGNHKLSQVLKVAMIKGGVKGTTREAVLAEAMSANAITLSNFKETGTLYPEDSTFGTTVSDIYGIIVFWAPNGNDTDNLYNMNNGKTTTDGQPLHIDLGISLLATQVEAENDSFGNNYDASAAVGVTNAAELEAALAEGGSIYLGNDVVLENPITVPASVAVALNLDGHTISGNQTKDAGALLVNAGTMTIFGGAMTNGTENGAAVIDNKGTLTLDDVTINGAPMGTTGYPAYAVATSGKLTVEEGTSILSDRGAISMSAGADVVINGGTFKVSNAADSRNMTLHTIYAYGSGSELTIYDGTFEQNHTSTGGASVICPAGATINIYGGDFRDVMDDTNWTSTGNFQNYMGYTAPVNVYGGTYDDTTVNKNLASGYKAVDNGNGTYTVTMAEDTLNDLFARGGTVTLPAGNYTMPDGSDINLQGKSLTVTGTKDTVVDASNVDERDQFVTGAELVFDGVTLNFGTTNYMGFANAKSLTFKNCTINGLQFLSGPKVTFENCVLNSNGAEHSVWTWGVQDVSFTDCDFTYGDRAVNCYAEHGESTNATFTNCTFTKVAGKATTGAIETNSSSMTGLNLTINNCSVNEGDLWWVASPWDSKGGANTYTTVDGKVIATTAKQLAGVVAKGATDIYLADGEYDVENCGGTLTINGSKNVVLKVMNEGEDGCDYGFGSPAVGAGNVTFNGLTIDTTSNTGNYKGYAYMKGVFNDCNFVGAYSLNNANDFTFNNCTFDFKNGYFWTWGANSVAFNGCTFNGNSKTILAHGTASTVININNCKFAATALGYTGSGDHTAVVEIDPVSSNTYTINFTGDNSINSNYAGWTRVKDGSTGHTITGV